MNFRPWTIHHGTTADELEDSNLVVLGLRRADGGSWAIQFHWPLAAVLTALLTLAVWSAQ